MVTRFCLPLTDLTSADLAIAGGKGANLGELLRAGFAVPPGFVLTTDAYREAVAGVESVGYEQVLAAGMPTPVRDAALAAYAELGGGVVAVRSSATAEDLPGAAFAGQQDTFLGVEGDEQLLDAVQRCWASLWTERAVSYRSRLEIDPATVAIAVVVQRLVPADQAGVMFTANPVTGARDQVVIDSNPGLGEAVVAGLVTPDHVVLDPDGAIVERREGRRETVITAVAGGGTREESTSDVAPLKEDDLRRLAEQGRRIAAHFGRPQDIEWAITDKGISILQSRPMTALPPAPIELNRFQRWFGPIVLELLPRRPYPLEMGAWTVLVVGRHLDGMVNRIAGAHVSFDRMLPTKDGVVQAFVPPVPHPSIRTPLRLARTVWGMRRDPRAWAGDSRHRDYLAATESLNDIDVAQASWRELVAIPDQAARSGDLVTELRAAYIPAAGGALARLRLLLRLLGRSELFGSLVLDLDTDTQQANAELASIADMIVGDPALARSARGLDGTELWNLVTSDPAAAEVSARLDAFLLRYGHRETASVLLPRDPTWSDSPETVLAIVAVLIAGEARRPDQQRKDPLDRLLAHPLLRASGIQRRVRRLVAKAAAAVAVREDTHFELTRSMPAVRHALIEMGQRLAKAGSLDEPDDVWFLTWSEVSAVADPSTTAPDPKLIAAARRRRLAMAELSASPLIATTTLYPGRGSRTDALANGVGGGGGRVSGAVRVIRGPDEFTMLRAGEVLVCPATNPSWTPLFARASAVVVDNGGLASHAAIVAREYGIPAVMGTGNGTSVLETGRHVVVDGDRGLVLVGQPDDDVRG